MRRLCLGLLGLATTACFEGGNATGLPCTDDSQCGEGIRCIDMVCGGGAAGSSETSVTATSTVGTSSSTSMSTESSSTQTSSDDSTTSGLDCAPTPTPGVCTAMPGGRSVTSEEVVDDRYRKVFAVATGNFVGDDAMELALAYHGNEIGVHIVERDRFGNWEILATQTDYLGPAVPYDVEVADFLCSGSPSLVFALQDQFLGTATWNGQMLSYVQIMGDANVEIPPGSFSAISGDFVPDPDNLIDVAIAGSGHVMVWENFGPNFGLYESFGVRPEGVPFFEPWGFEVLHGSAENRILVGAGGVAGAATPSVYSFRVDGDSPNNRILREGMPPVLAATFSNPFALAVGFFDDDGVEDLAVGERNINVTDPPDSEDTDLPGRVRFFRMIDGDPDMLVEFDELSDGVTVDIGLRAMTAADFDCDGLTDVLVGYTGAPGGAGGIPEILFGGDLGTRVPAGTTAVHSASKLGVGDVDGDGRPEGIVGDYGGASLNEDGNRVLIIDVE